MGEPRKRDQDEARTEDQIERLIKALEGLNASTKTQAEELQLHRVEMARLADTERALYHLVHEILDGLDQAPKRLAGTIVHKLFGIPDENKPRRRDS